MAISIENFEQISFNPFDKNDTIFGDENDPDLNYFDDENFQNYETPYVFCEETKSLLHDTLLNENFSIIYLNIRSLNANFDNFRNMLSECDHCFNIICLSETWCTDDEFLNNSNYHIPNYNAIHQERKTGKRGGGVLIYIKENLTYKVRNDLSFSNSDNEMLSIEIVHKHKKNTLVTCCYRPPNGNQNIININLDKVLNSINFENKKYFILGDFNNNCLNYHEKAHIKLFYDNLFQHGTVPLINKPTRVTSNSVSIIDNIFTNCIFDISLKKGIIKSDITDHFPIFVALNVSNCKLNTRKVKVTKRYFDEENKQSFKNDLINVNWHQIETLEDPDTSYNNFSKIFSELYNKNFPINEYNLKTKDLNNPWMSKGLKKSSKLKQKLYIKFLKNKTLQNEETYKNYKNLLKKLKSVLKIIIIHLF